MIVKVMVCYIVWSFLEDLFNYLGKGCGLKRLLLKLLLYMNF